jgi:uncharacterized RDD family membrane protein YckC
MTTRLTNFSVSDEPALATNWATDVLVPMHGPATDSAAEQAGACAKSAGVVANPGSWREEVAVRLERYRTRRKPRTPRYPSLLLPFDAPETWLRSAPPPALSPVAATTAAQIEQDSIFQINNEESALIPGPGLDQPGQTSRHREATPATEQDSYPHLRHATDSTAKVIEFPRSAAIPVFQAPELAEPVFDHPRIVEVPEILPPPPALGGMLIESSHLESNDRRVDIPAASSSASIPRRALAALIDSAVLVPALAAFAAIFFDLNPFYLNSLYLHPLYANALNPTVTPPRGQPVLLATGLGVAAIFLWAAYKFLFIVYTGSTPGLRIARLRLARFDGSPLNRRLRRWRVLASLLSTFSAGLGYFWCVLDENGLCWHDRITHTHVLPVSQTK